MTISDIATLFLYCSLFLFVFGAIAFCTAMAPPWWCRKANIKDYDQGRVVFGGMLGLSRILALIALGLLSAGGIAKFLL